jgi:carotenoid cleavage dioxygenase
VKRLQNSLLISFIPWIFFGIFSSSIFFGSLGALALMILLNFEKLKKGFILPWGSIILFAFLPLNALLHLIPLSSIGTYRLINSTLALIAVFSLLIKRPFTIQYARLETDPSQWHEPLFLKVNYILTSIWATLMIIMAIPSFLFTYEQIRKAWEWNYGLMIVCVAIGMKCNSFVRRRFKK